MSRNGSVGVGRGESEVGDEGTGWALGVEKNPETDLEFQPSATSCSRMGLGWELILIWQNNEQQLTRLRACAVRSKQKGRRRWQADFKAP